MVKLKTIHLVNYCGYRDSFFDFRQGDGVKHLVTFFGPNGIGKCLSGDTNVLVDDALVKIRSLFPSDLPDEDTWIELDNPVDLGVNGFSGQCSRVYYAGKKSSVSITSSMGYALTGSKDLHQVLSVKDGSLQFVKLDKLSEGDFIAISRKPLPPSDSSNKDSILESTAALFGYLISEGYIPDKGQTKFHNTDLEVLDDFDSLLMESYGVKESHRNWKKQEDRLDSCAIGIDAKTRNKMLKDGLCTGLSGDKHVPESIFKGDFSASTSFLSSYFEGDGGVERNISAISCASKSKQLMQDIQMLLLRMGIICSLHERHTDKLSYTDKPYTSWRLYIQGYDVFKFSTLIGFRSTRKKAELSNLISILKNTIRNPNLDIVPVSLFRPIAEALKDFRMEAGLTFSRQEYKHSANGLHVLQDNYLDLVKNGVSRYKIENCVMTLNKKIVTMNEDSGGVAISPIDLDDATEGLWDEDYFFDTIKSISQGEEELFDLEVQGHHRFWSNGFISHNTTALNAARLAASAPVYFSKLERGHDRTKQLLRSMIHDDEYLPSVDAMKLAEKKKMKIEAVFLTENGDKKVIIDNDGLLLNELPDLPMGQPGYAYFSDSDNPMSTQKFMLAEEFAHMFLHFAQEVYGYPVELCSPTSTQGIRAYTDCLIKKGTTKVHYKRMSAGEKKIATVISDLCQPINTENRDLIFIDNVVMHVYFKRHTKMIDNLRECFPNKQILTTTHSSHVIDYVPEDCAYDMEKYRPDYKLFNIDKVMPVIDPPPFQAMKSFWETLLELNEGEKVDK